MAFTHLHVHSSYSLLDGSGKIPEMVARIKELGMDSIALTDHGVMYGVIDFYKEAKKQGIHPVLGSEIYLSRSMEERFIQKGEARYYHLVLLAENDIGYHNLMKLVSLGFTEGYYYKPRVDYEVLENTMRESLPCPPVLRERYPETCGFPGMRRQSRLHFAMKAFSGREISFWKCRTTVMRSRSW